MIASRNKFIFFCHRTLIVKLDNYSAAYCIEEGEWLKIDDYIKYSGMYLKLEQI